MGRKTDLSGLDMRKFKRVQTRTAMEKNVAAQRNVTLPAELRQLSMESSDVVRPKPQETGFLLDWLSGGEVFQRRIEGFSLGFELRN
jgi:hypothetical protein